MALILFPEHFKTSLLLLGIVLTAAMVGFTILGRRVGAKFLAGETEDPPGLGAIEGALFALFGLLVALTFAGALDRLQVRKDLLQQEARSISTAYSRLSLLPESSQGPLKAGMRDFLAALIAAYRQEGSLEALEAALSAAEASGVRVLELMVRACRTPEGATYSEVVLPPVNDMLDAATARRLALHSHPPTVVYELLVILALLCAFLGGFGMSRAKRRSWIHILSFAMTSAVMLCVTLDIEHPRYGFIQIRNNDRLLVEILNPMR